MKFVKVAFLAVAAATVLSACCHTASTKCYPYPLYDYSPARICGASCAPGTHAHGAPAGPAYGAPVGY